MMAGYGNLKKMQILWNRIDARERKDIYSEYDAFMESIGLEAMKTTIPASVRFKRGLSANPKSKVFRVDRELRANILYSGVIGIESQKMRRINIYVPRAGMHSIRSPLMQCARSDEGPGISGVYIAGIRVHVNAVWHL